MTLEESIDYFVRAINTTDPVGREINTTRALRQFAKAIKEPEGRCCDNGHFGEAHKCQKQPPEPKECGCPPMAHPGHCCCPNCRESCKPADELPKEVKEAICYYSNVILGMGIDPTKAAHDEIDGYMTKVARLCFEIASRGRG